MAHPILILGLGNVLMCDDGAGVHAGCAISPRPGTEARCCGGRRGHARPVAVAGGRVLPALIVFDAAMFGAAPGAVRVLSGADMDAQLSGRKTTVHEVALADLLATAELLGSKPARRALIGVQPNASTGGCLRPRRSPPRSRHAGRRVRNHRGVGAEMAGSETDGGGGRDLLDALCGTRTPGSRISRKPGRTRSTSAHCRCRRATARRSSIGRGEVSAHVEVAGRSEIWRRSFPACGACATRRRDIAADPIEITPCPDIAADPRDAGRRGARLADASTEQRSRRRRMRNVQSLAH